MISRAQAKAKRVQDAAEKAAINADAFVAAVAAMTPAQVSTYIDNNVTTLAGARQVLKGMGKLMILLARDLQK